MCIFGILYETPVWPCFLYHSCGKEQSGVHTGLNCTQYYCCSSTCTLVPVGLFFLWIPFRFECFNDFLYKKSTDTFKTTHYLQQYRTTRSYVIIVPSRVLLSILIVQPLRQDTSSAYVVSYCSKVLYYLIMN